VSNFEDTLDSNAVFKPPVTCSVDLEVSLSAFAVADAGFADWLRITLDIAAFIAISPF
jgi:hypothetical protein